MSEVSNNKRTLVFMWKSFICVFRVKLWCRAQLLPSDKVEPKLTVTAESGRSIVPTRKGQIARGPLLWLGPITPTPSTRSVLTRVAVSPSSTHTSTRIIQRLHWTGLWTLLCVFGCVVYSRQSSTIRKAWAQNWIYWRAYVFMLPFGGWVSLTSNICSNIAPTLWPTLADSGKEKLSFHRKKPLAEPSSGRGSHLLPLAGGGGRQTYILCPETSQWCDSNSFRHV